MNFEPPFGSASFYQGFKGVTHVLSPSTSVAIVFIHHLDVELIFTHIRSGSKLIDFFFFIPSGCAVYPVRPSYRL